MSAQMSNSDKSYKRSIEMHTQVADKRPDKGVEGRKYKRRDRQRGKKQAKERD